MTGAQDVEGAVGGGARLLLADDEGSFCEATGELLRRSGYRCDCASDGAEALSALERSSYDLLIADLKMPGNESLELLSESARRWPTMALLILTGHPSLPTAISALRLAVADYRIKPVTARELLQAVDQGLRRSGSMQALQEVGDEMQGWVEALRRWEPRVPGAPGALAASAARLREASTDGLSQREREIAECVARGERVATIAGSLHISQRTVRNHLQSIFRKLGVHSQLELAARLHGPGSTRLR